MSFLKLLTPTNLATEREHFFASSDYNPQFEYAWDAESLNAWGTSQPHYAPLAQAVSVQDNESMTRAASDIFGVAYSEQLEKTAQSLTQLMPERTATPSQTQIADSFARAFSQLGLHEYHLEIAEATGFNFRPSVSQKKIVMSAHANFDYFSLDGEIRHELSHVLRAENGIVNHISYSQNYLQTEEGLAAYMQDFGDADGQRSLYQHACEYLVTGVLLNGSLRDGFNFLKSKGFSDELAWQRVIRHKYGWKDTAQSGDTMKPAMYFAYEQQVKNHTTEQQLRLYVGKISIDDLPQYPEYFGRFSAEVLQDFFNLT